MSTRDRLKQWRNFLGLTQQQFCERTGIPLRTLRGYEGGTRHPGEDALAAIARTGVNMTWLLTGEGEMLPR
jgi:transcriptional regulator with XRE-family HTH domain